MFAARQHLDYANRKAHIKEIAEWFRGSGIPLNSVHSPLYADYEWGRAGAPPINLASTDRAGLVEAMDEVKRALEIEERYKISFWDALIVRAAQTSGADILYSEDLNDGQVYGSVRVVNPLRA